MKKRFYFYISTILSALGIGMLAGTYLGDNTKKAPVIVGVILIVSGALFFGMFAATHYGKNPKTDSKPDNKNSKSPTDSTTTSDKTSK